MPKFYCDSSDTYLTHDSPSVRKTHHRGRKHKENVKCYQKWMGKQSQSLIDKTTTAYQQGKMPPTPFSASPPAGAMIPPPTSFLGPPCPGMMPAPRMPPMGGHMPMTLGPPVMRPPTHSLLVPTQPQRTPSPLLPCEDTVRRQTSLNQEAGSH
uniref:U1 small nuclear ribonucleoprotein C n=1 Tax=Panthera tigris altaica TaxID=74533 RepID=A0A8C9JX57_PANTA